LEIDISNKVKTMVQGGIIGLLLLTILLSGGIWWWQHNQGYVLIHNASVKGMGVNASVKVAGVVTDVMVKDGDTVEVGQALAKIKINVSPEQVQQLEQAVESAKLRYNELLTRPAPTMTTVTAGDSNQGDVAAAQAAVDKTAANKDRMDKLFEIGAVSAMQRNNATNAYQAAEEALNAAKQGSASSSSSVQVNNTQDTGQLLKLAKFQLEQAEMALTASSQVDQVTAVLAPVAGVVNYTEVKAGDTIEAGQPIFTVGDAGNLWVEVQVDEKQIDKLKLGQFVNYSIENYPEQIFKGTVFEIASEASNEGTKNNEKAQGLPIKISLPVDTDFVFKAGMKVDIKIRSN
jgi:multidrug resistance efflux pump